MKKILGAVLGVALLTVFAVGCSAENGDDPAEHTGETTQALPKCNTDGVCPNEGPEHPYCGAQCSNKDVLADNGPGRYSMMWLRIPLFWCPDPFEPILRTDSFGRAYCASS